MTLRINTNIAALRTVRNLEDKDRNLTESLMRLSSGFKINKASDNPAGLVISEQMRGQIVGLNQAIANSELATTMVQTAEGSLTEVNNLLIRMRQLALHANNQGGNDPQALEADQLEIKDGLQTIARIAKNTQFGNRKLLDGSAGISGETQGAGLTFLSATKKTHTSPVEGYQVDVTRVATRARMEGTTELSQDNLPGLQVTLFEGGKTVKVTADPQDTPASFFGKLRAAAEQNDLSLDLGLTEDNRIVIMQKKYGSEHTFQASSSAAGVLSQEPGVLEAAEPGEDIQGTLNGEAAVGQGQVLRGLTGNEDTEGLAVRYSGPLVMVREQGLEDKPVFEHLPQPGIAGTVNVVNNALEFQVGPNPGQTVSVALPQVDPRSMGKDVDTQSHFHSLADIDVTTGQGARDSIRMIDAATDQLTLMRGRLGAFAKNSLESNVATLRVTAENLMAAESTIRDTDMAKELVTFTKNKIMVDSAAAMVAHANQIPKTVVKLLE